MHALILAAGYGTRANGFAGDKPKQLLNIAGVPVIERIIDNILASRFIENVYVITNSKFLPQFEEWLASWYARKATGKSVLLINNGTRSNEERLGAVGDILYGINAIEQMEGGCSSLLVAQGDDLYHNLSIDNLLFSQSRKGAGYVLVHRAPVNLLAERFGVVEVSDNGMITSVREKPKLEDIRTADGHALANGGLYVFTESDLFKIKAYKAAMSINGSPLDNTGRLLDWMVRNQSALFAHKHPLSDWYDCGRLDEVERANLFYGRQTQ